MNGTQLSPTGRKPKALAGNRLEIRTPAVELRNVSMSYAGQKAVVDASFSLHQGSFLTILGPSGSGKTTLLRMIAGFQKPSGGEILISGAPVNAVPPHQRSIGMVFQKLALFPHMTAEENIAFPLKMRRFDARTIPNKVEQFLDLVKLGCYGKRRIHELSGGQQQRVAIARALVFEPDLLLLDEPLAALDRKLREEMQLEFRRIQRELGVTTINVTHDQREALVVSNEIIVMDKGRIQQNAKPSTIYREPTNAFVAGFIGVTNFLTGEKGKTKGDDIVLSVAGAELHGKWLGNGAVPTTGAQVSGALRAEQIRISATKLELASMDMVFAARIKDIIFEGERVVYEAVLPSLDGMILRVFDHQPLDHTEFEPNSHVFLGWNSRDLLVYKPDPIAG